MKPGDTEPRIVTEQQAAELDEARRQSAAQEAAARRQSAAREAAAKGALKYLGPFGIDEHHFRIKEQSLFQRFGRPPTKSDVVWGLFNDALARERDLHNVKRLHFGMALFLLREGRDPFEHLQHAARAELLDLKASGVVRKVKIGAAGNGCDACNRLDGKVLTIARALREMPIPNRSCTELLDDDDYRFAWCRCTYLAVLN